MELTTNKDVMKKLTLIALFFAALAFMLLPRTAKAEEAEEADEGCGSSPQATCMANSFPGIML